jgi:hypothetical protein
LVTVGRNRDAVALFDNFEPRAYWHLADGRAVRLARHGKTAQFLG